MTDTSGSQAAVQAAEDTIKRIREMNEQLIERSKATGIASLDAYERTLESMVALQEQTSGASQIEWVDALAKAHAKYVQDVSKAYTDAARSMLS